MDNVLLGRGFSATCKPQNIAIKPMTFPYAPAHSTLSTACSSQTTTVLPPYCPPTQIKTIRNTKEKIKLTDKLDIPY
jgi:hypothetical protein